MDHDRSRLDHDSDFQNTLISLTDHGITGTEDPITPLAGKAFPRCFRLVWLDIVKACRALSCFVVLKKFRALANLTFHSGELWSVEGSPIHFDTA